MKILGIETSCDETSASIVTSEREILSNVIYSQFDEHKSYGGVVPEIASRAHIDKIEDVVATALEESKLTLEDVDAIAVTAGPGLIGGVIVGVMTAKAYAAAAGKPLICVNHLEGHALTCRLTDDVEFPFLLLLASGGHCQFILAEDVGEYKILGRTLDDALGEAFDKTAKIMGLGYPGGPIIEKLALKGNSEKYKFPEPLKRKKGCDFSFSGLKTAVLREVKNLGDNISEQDAADISASFQNTVCRILDDRVSNAIEIALDKNPHIENFVLSGGVAANKVIAGKLRDICAKNNLKFYSPPLELCTDNAAMIAWSGLERFQKGWQNDLSFIPRARWSLEDKY